MPERPDSDRLPPELVSALAHAFAAALIKEFRRRHGLDGEVAKASTRRPLAAGLTLVAPTEQQGDA